MPLYPPPPAPGGGGMVVGNPVTGGIATRGLFIDAAGNLAQDPNFTFDPASGRMIVGAFTSLSDVRGSGTGGAGTPDITFATDPDTGMFDAAANQLGFATQGVERFRITNTGLLALLGAAATPAYAFTGDADTGMFSPAANRLRWSTGGVAQWEIQAAGHFIAVTDGVTDIGAALANRPRDLFTSGHVYTGNGVAGAPSLTFDANASSGLYSPGVNRLGFATFSNARWEMDANGNFLAAADNTVDIGATGATRPKDLHIAGRLFAGAGAAATPGVSFDADQDTGTFNVSANQIGWSLGGVQAMGLGSSVPDTDQSLAIGRAVIDSRVADLAYFSHRDNTATTDYAIRQSAAGATAISCKTGQSVIISIANATTRLTANGTGLGFFGATAVAQSTGWAAITNPVSRKTFDTTTVTLSQLAEFVGTLSEYIKSLGLIST